MDTKCTSNALPDISEFDHSNTTIGTVQLLWNKVVQMKPVQYALFGTIFIALFLCFFILCACCFMYHPLQLVKICCCQWCKIRLQERGRNNQVQRSFQTRKRETS